MPARFADVSTPERRGIALNATGFRPANVAHYRNQDRSRGRLRSADYRSTKAGAPGRLGRAQRKPQFDLISGVLSTMSRRMRGLLLRRQTPPQADRPALAGIGQRASLWYPTLPTPRPSHDAHPVPCNRRNRPLLLEPPQRDPPQFQTGRRFQCQDINRSVSILAFCRKFTVYHCPVNNSLAMPRKITNNSRRRYMI